MRRWILLLVAAALAVGCASTFDFRREEVFEDTVRAYGRLITWSDFGTASAYLAPDAENKTVPKGVRVASYDFKQLVYTHDKQAAVNIIEISYYRENDMRLKTIMDQQLWQFNAAKQAWQLKSGFPPF
ncbi:MAG: hypothetical protein MUE48_13710 [Desulfobacterales bacterium]|jgi:hypothetical protein|nr:hypothetical protein [Desulfobacterales bacterium]